MLSELIPGGKRIYLFPHLINDRKMSEHASETKISRLLADGYSQKILSYTYRKPMSAQRLSKICRIPIAACYRRIHDLEKAGLIFISEEREVRKGRKVKLYRCSLRSATLRFSHGKFKVDYDTSDRALLLKQMADGGNLSYSDDGGNGGNGSDLLDDEEDEKPRILNQSS